MGWFNLDTLGKLTSSAVALVGSISLAALFITLVWRQPEIRTEVARATFIDLDSVVAAYAPSAVPPLVAEVAGAYNRVNSRDLAVGSNRSSGEIHTSELCDAVGGRRVEAYFPGTNCAGSRPRLGRGRFYERLLVCRNEEARTGDEGLCGIADKGIETDAVTEPTPALGVPAVHRAIDVLAGAEYQQARVMVLNCGTAPATDVAVSPPDGYTPLGVAAEFELPPTRVPDQSGREERPDSICRSDAPPDNRAKATPQPGRSEYAWLTRQLSRLDADVRSGNFPDLPAVRSFDTEVGGPTGVAGVVRQGDPSGGQFLAFRASWSRADRVQNRALLVGLAAGALAGFALFSIADFVQFRRARDAAQQQAENPDELERPRSRSGGAG